jgi:hypothetical protein
MGEDFKRQHVMLQLDNTPLSKGYYPCSTPQSLLVKAGKGDRSRRLNSRGST